MTVNAIAVLSTGDRDDFDFEIEESASDKEIVNKAFEIAYCKHIDLEQVLIDSIER